MLLTINYLDEQEPTIVESNKIFYAYVENQVIDNDKGEKMINPNGNVVLKLETINNEIATEEIRSFLYTVYRQVITNISNIKSIQLHSSSNEENSILLLDTATLGLIPQSISMFDGALFPIENSERYQGITVQIILSWKIEEEKEEE